MWDCCTDLLPFKSSVSFWDIISFSNQKISWEVSTEDCFIALANFWEDGLFLLQSEQTKQASWDSNQWAVPRCEELGRAEADQLKCSPKHFLLCVLLQFWCVSLKISVTEEFLLPKPQQSLDMSVQGEDFGSLGSNRPFSEISPSLNAQLSSKSISLANTLPASSQNARFWVQISHAKTFGLDFFPSRDLWLWLYACLLSSRQFVYTFCDLSLHKTILSQVFI